MEKWIEHVFHCVPDWLTGKTEVMRQKYCQRYGNKDCSKIILDHKKKLFYQYMIIFIIFVIFFIFALIGRLMNQEEVRILDRPDSDKESISVPMIAHLSYKGFQIDQKLLVKVKPHQLDSAEKEKQLVAFENQLETIILGKNKDLNHISSSLNLIGRDKETGITVEWTSDRPDVINEEGELDLLNADGSVPVKLEALIMLDDLTDYKEITVETVSEPPLGAVQKSLIKKLEEKMQAIEEDTFSESAQLPDHLNKEISVYWSRENKSGMGLAAGIAVFIFFILFMKRYDGIDKEIQNDTESILCDLPDFTNKLVLLLNAGMVVSSALIKIADDYERSSRQAENNRIKRQRKRLYEELCEIKIRVYQSHSFMMKELIEFAQRSGIREFVRLTFIISDNWNKGSSLAEKLEAESSMLWIGRKKTAEEKGRLAETKLTFPLVVSLIILIMVTIAPAMMVM